MSLSYSISIVITCTLIVATATVPYLKAIIRSRQKIRKFRRTHKDKPDKLPSTLYREYYAGIFFFFLPYLILGIGVGVGARTGALFSPAPPNPPKEFVEEVGEMIKCYERLEGDVVDSINVDSVMKDTLSGIRAGLIRLKNIKRQLQTINSLTTENVYYLKNELPLHNQYIYKEFRAAGLNINTCDIHLNYIKDVPRDFP